MADQGTSSQRVLCPFSGFFKRYIFFPAYVFYPVIDALMFLAYFVLFFAIFVLLLLYFYFCIAFFIAIVYSLYDLDIK